MTVIAVINTKGGAGKTTSAIFLAAAAHRAGYTVKVFDADPQGTATEWSYKASENDTPLPFDVTSINTAMVRRGRLDRDVDVAILDTPTGDSSVVGAAIEAASFVVVPTRTTNADLWRTLPTAEVVGDTPQGILITQARSRTRALAQAKALLEDESLSFFDEVIPLREGISDAVGGVPRELYGYDAVLEHILEMEA